MRRPPEDIVRSIESTYFKALADLVSGIPGAVVLEEPDMTILQTSMPHSLFNGVIGPEFTVRNMAGRVKEVMARFRKAKLPMRWMLGPSSTPRGLDSYLRRQGLAEGYASPGMAIDLETVSRRRLPPGLDIRPVEDMATLRVCGDTLAKGFELKGIARKGMADVAMAWGIGSVRRWYLGYLDEAPVAVSNLTFHGDVAAIYCVATIPEARGRGIGSAVTHWPLLVAKRLGYEIAVIEASKMGFPVYERMGFKEYCRFRTYLWTPE